MYIGIFITIYYSFSLLSKIYSHFIMRGYNLYIRYKGGWAIVTGATNGIGLAYSY